jgi:MHS family alpha-ketoglutarate permease-like MFS transporter
VALKLRSTLKETSTEKSRSHKDAGSTLALFTKYRRSFITVFGYTAGGSLIFYTFTTYMQKYLVNTSGFSVKSASNVMTWSLLVFALVQPLFGALSDKIGRRTSMLLFSALGALITVPVISVLQSTHDAMTSFILISLALCVVSLYTSVAGIVKAEMFPIEVRASGVGFAYAIGNALFGGTAELIALSLKTNGHADWFFWYVTVMMVFVFFVSLTLHKKPEYLAQDN